MADNLSRLMFYYKEDRPWPVLRLTSAAMVGHVMPNIARIWVRVHTPGDYCFVLSKNEIVRTAKITLEDSGGIKLVAGRRRVVERFHRYGRWLQCHVLQPKNDRVRG